MPTKLTWCAITLSLLVGLGLVVKAVRNPIPILAEREQLNRDADSDNLSYRPASINTQREPLQSTPFVVGASGLSARPRPSSPVADTAKVGAAVHTKSHERRRLVLSDGSVVYVNADTSFKVVGDRQLQLDRGEVFLEVAPRATAGQSGESFTVHTPDRTVTALGTKFTVRTQPAGTGVVVTQGKVRVSGLSQLLTAGRQLVPRQRSADNVAPARRASHVLQWTRDLRTAAESPPVPNSQYAGGALVAVDPDGQQTRLSLRKVHVDVHIEDGFARTTIDQTYFNHTSSRLEGTFYFPLPADASLSRLAMYVSGKLMEGGMVEHNRARDVFETIVTRQKDPALLEWMDGSTFKMRVFPLEGRQEKRIVLSYSQRLAPRYGRTQYRFPAGHNLGSVRDWSFHTRCVSAAGKIWKSPSHKMTGATDGDDLLLDSQAKNVKVDHDVVLELTDHTEKTSQTGMARFAETLHEGRRYFMVRYRPELPVEPKRERRDWVFLFESSADRDPLLARVQIDVIRTMLDNAEHDDTFTILAVGTQVTDLTPSPNLGQPGDGKSRRVGQGRSTSAGPPLVWTSELVGRQPLRRLGPTLRSEPCIPANIEKAVARLEKVHLIGALDLEAGLAAANERVKACKSPYVVHVGSGIPVLGERREDALARMISANATYVGVAVGKRWSRPFMKAAAERTGGHFTQINPDEDVVWRAFDLVSLLNTPRLLGVRVVDDAERIAFLSLSESIAEGEEVCAMARLEPGINRPQHVTIAGWLDGKQYVRRLEVSNVRPGADYLPRMWARQEIDRLLAHDALAHRDTIIGLSKQMYVMSPFTSLLVLENEQMYQQYNVDRGRKDHWALYPCPETIPVVREPLVVRHTVPAPVPAEAEKNVSAHDVLATIVDRAPPSIMFQPVRPVIFDSGLNTLMSNEFPVTAYVLDEHESFGFVPHHDAAHYLYYNGTSPVLDGFERKNVQQLLERGESLNERWGFVDDPVTSNLRIPLAQSSFGWPMQRMRAPQFATYDAYSRLARSDNYGVGGTAGSDVAFSLLDLQRDVAATRVYPVGDLVIQTEDFSDIAHGIGQHRGFFKVLDSLQRKPRRAVTDSRRRLNEGEVEALHRRYSQLMHNGFYRDAEVIANLIADTAPDQVTGHAALWKARFASDYGLNKDLEVTRPEGWWETLRSAEVTPSVSIRNAVPTQWLDAKDWKELTIRRQKYKSVDLTMKSARTREIERALSRPVSFDFEETPLTDVVDFLRDYTNANIVVDRNGLDVAAVREDSPVTLRLQEVTLKSALRLLLERKGLQAIVRDEVLLITDGAESDRLLETRVYPYVGTGPPKDVVKLILSTISPHTWESNGGKGRIEYFAPNRSFVVTQSRRAHEELESLFEQLGASGGSTGEFIRRMSQHRPTVLYKKPSLSSPTRLFRDLLVYAPGLHAGPVDSLAVLEEELPESARPKRGSVDPQARALIDRARSAGWEALTHPGEKNGLDLTIAFDGSGRFHYQRTTPDGLRAEVVCDGTTLLHEYAEIGLGAQRKVNRLHRVAALRLVPWLVLPADDLAVGADVKLVDERTIAIVPIGVQGKKDSTHPPTPTFPHKGGGSQKATPHPDPPPQGGREQEDSPSLQRSPIKQGGNQKATLHPEALAQRGRESEGNPPPRPSPTRGEGVKAVRPTYAEERLVFADDGRLAERMLVEMPGEKALMRVTYASDGHVKVIDQDGKTLAERNLNRRPASMPSRLGRRDDLVYLPMPARSSAHVRKTVGRKDHYSNWNEGDALALATAHYATWNPSELHDVITIRFLERGDRRRGFQVLLLASAIDAGQSLRDQLGKEGLPLITDSPLVRYLLTFDNDANGANTATTLADRNADAGFLDVLAELRILHGYWTGPHVATSSLAERKAMRKRTFAFARNCRSPGLAWLALFAMADGDQSETDYDRFADALDRFERVPGLAYCACYERARAVLKAGDLKRARSMYTKLYEDVRDVGLLPAVDSDFSRAFANDAQGKEAWKKLMRETAGKWREVGDRSAGILLAWQCHTLGDRALAEELLSKSLADIDDRDRLPIMLLAVQYLAQIGQLNRALDLLQPCLDGEQPAAPALWRLAFALAGRSGHVADAVKYLDRAMDIEYRHLPDTIDLKRVRNEYRNLLTGLQQWTDAVVDLDARPPEEFAGRVVRAADRWRLLDTDVTDACNRAAKILRQLGEDDLAWAYLTTPLAEKPNESAPWRTLAKSLRDEDAVDLAGKAFAVAFEIEPTDPAILLEHAQMLDAAKRTDAAKRLFRKIADGDWQPRFRSTQQQARQKLGL